MNLQEYIDYVLSISTQTATEPHGLPILDAQMAVEVFLPAIFRQVTRRALRNNKQHSLMNEHTIAVVSESGTLPAGVEEEFACTFQVGEDNTNLGLFSWYPSYFDYIRETDTRLPRFTVRDRKIYVTKEGSVADGNILLYGLTIPQVPADATTAIDVGDEILDDCLTLSASVLRGEVPMSVIGL